MVRVPFGPRRLLGVVVELAEASELPPERLAEPIEALEAGAPAELVGLGLWVAREYCSTPSRGPAAGAAAGYRHRAAAPCARRLELRAEILPAGEAALSGGERLGVKQRAVLEALRGGEMSAAELAAAVGSDRQTLRRLEQREPDRDPQLAAAPRARAARASRRRAERPQLLPEQERAVAAILAALDGEAGAPRAAAPARRHRLGQDRGLPGRGRGGARARPRRDRPRPGDRPRAAGGGPLPRPPRRPLRRPALGPLGRRALRRVAAPAQRRGAASASARARPSSPRSATSA